MTITEWQDEHPVRPDPASPGSTSPPPGLTRGRASRSNETAGVLRPILDTFCHGLTRLWRNNVGVLQDRNGRPVAYGLGSEGGRALPGTSDTIGIHSVTITPEMVGRQVGVFVAIEAKDRADLTPQQRAFILNIHRLGGIAGCARSVDDARAILQQGPWQPPLGL